MFFSIFSSGGHFIQRSGIIGQKMVKGHKRNISKIIIEIILKSGHWPRRRRRLNVVVFFYF